MEIGQIRVGVTEIDITPPLSWETALGGSTRAKPMEGVHDPIYARILVFERQKIGANSIEAVIINIDQVGLPISVIEMIKKPLHPKFGVDSAKIFIYCTHNHYTPDMTGLMPAPIMPKLFNRAAANLNYAHLLVYRIMQAFPKALHTFDATLAFHQSQYPRRNLVNRRARWEHKSQILHPRLTVVGIKDTQKQLRAVILILPQHDTLIDRELNEIAGGLTGSFCKSVSTITSNQPNPAIGFYLQGPAGDVAHTYDIQIHNQILKDSPHHPPDMYAYCKQWGMTFARDCIDKLASLQFDPIEVQSFKKNIYIPNYPYVNMNLWNNIKDVVMWVLKSGFALPFIGLFRINRWHFLKFIRHPPYGKHSLFSYAAINTEISILCLNTLFLINTPGEPFTSMGKYLETKARQVLGNRFQYAITELCDDCMGYVYTDLRTIQLQDGYEPTMGVSPLFGTYLAAWVAILLKQFRLQLELLRHN
jgi:hypothetical protein